MDPLHQRNQSAHDNIQMTGESNRRFRRLIVIALASAFATACTNPSVDGPAPTTALRDAQPAVVGTVWISTDATAPSGTLRIFLADGTLLMDSCNETYRLARWESLDREGITWEEDGARIDAAIVRAAPDGLQLQLRLFNDVRVENYRPARVPYVCPDSRP